MQSMRVAALMMVSLFMLKGCGDGDGFGVKPEPPVITTPSILEDARVGYAYSVLLETNSPNAPFLWGIDDGALPPGLALDQGLGRVSGTAQEVGIYEFVITLKDALNSTSYKPFQVAVRGDKEVTIDTETLPNARVDVPYIASLEASGLWAEQTWGLVGELPDGLDLENERAQIASIEGTPTTPGVFEFIIKVETETGLVDARRLAITVAP